MLKQNLKKYILRNFFFQTFLKYNSKNGIKTKIERDLLQTFIKIKKNKLRKVIHYKKNTKLRFWKNTLYFQKFKHFLISNVKNEEKKYAKILKKKITRITKKKIFKLKK